MVGSKVKRNKKTHPLDTHLGKRLRDFRLALNFSQGAIAEESGITGQQIQKYERGQDRMAVSRLWGFCETLKIPIEDFFKGYKDETFDSFLDEQLSILSDKDITTLVLSYKKLDKGEKEILLKIITRMAKGDKKTN